MNFLAGLNDEQKEAVETLEGPLLVLAGAGSGKTRVVTFRIANLLENGILPGKILGVTFTNKAANEMKERVRKITESNVTICTFHSLGVRVLRESIHALGYSTDFTIYDEEDALKLLRNCLDELHIKDKKLEPKTFKGMISRAKNSLLAPEEVVAEAGSAQPADKHFPAVYSRYQSYLKQYNAVDFDDLLYLTVKLFREHPSVLEYYQDRWSHLLIDEYQDTNQAQYQIVKLLVTKSGNVCAVGDPDQSIYSWRGANIQNILNFENDFPGARVIRLERNYRSRSNILDAANTVIGYNHNRYEKNLWSDLGPGERIKLFACATEKEEAQFVAQHIRSYREKLQIPYKDMAVFYRTNAQSRALEDRLLFQRIPYVIVGGLSFYQRREIKDILAFLRMAHSGSDFISFSRTINIPKRGVGGTTLEKVRAGALQEGMTILDYCRSLIGGEALLHPLKLTARQKQGLGDYLTIIRELRRISRECSLKELVTSAIEYSGYLGHLQEDPDTYDDRKQNLDELIVKAMEWEALSERPTLSGFLEELSLKSTLDETQGEEDRINLMTIHNGKGLEYTLVFLVGMEEELFPHANSRGSASAVEEERRLCYVGMTRAKEYLYLTRARMRYLWGIERYQRPSRFLKEIPLEFIETVGPETRHDFAEAADAPFIDEIDQTAGFDPDSAIVTGDTITHKDFGIGVVEEVFQGSLGLAYKIRFMNDNCVKTIVAKYAHLAKI